MRFTADTYTLMNSIQASKDLEILRNSIQPIEVPEENPNDAYISYEESAEKLERDNRYLVWIINGAAVVIFIVYWLMSK